MGALGNGGFWWNFPAGEGRGDRCKRRRKCKSSSSDSINLREERGWPHFDFPVKQAAIAASLALTGDTIAQFRDRIFGRGRSQLDVDAKEASFWSNHDWLRSLRMASYGFLLYGPGSYAWYQLLDQFMPKQTFITLSTKVILNQIVLGPCVIAVIFAWNNLWLGKLSELPAKYQNDALPTLLYGFRFWIPVTILNFGIVPLPARVAFMSTCSIFWNFYLSSTMSR
ncbi:protein Mpv17 isoform X2 [Dendrobium catenatum]|uniref:protein Mpv17 isoform X2 n=1 Tax=Dendrobium catenatum TaxID=906689 RepID=UPI0009F65505|nr:protein Mpv17 isoform X2 [Dendrobium catenatum]